MSEVVGLFDKAVQQAPTEAGGDPEVIAWAKDLVAKAECGQIDGFVVVASCADGSVIHMHCGAVEFMSVVGGLSHMEHFLNAKIKERW